MSRVVFDVLTRLCGFCGLEGFCLVLRSDLGVGDCLGVSSMKILEAIMLQEVFNGNLVELVEECLKWVRSAFLVLWSVAGFRI